MQHFYDGQIRRYLTQTMRVFSNFIVRYSDGTLNRVPVLYGDADRQAASILRQNSENKVNSVPRISVYINELKMDRNRLADATFIGKVRVRERDIEVDAATGNQLYTRSQGRNYTVERLMPTPFILEMKVDIWAANTDQKLQLLEQILVLFNPSLELQTTDNYIDWTSLSVLNLIDIHWSSRSIPVGVDSPIEVCTLTVDSPIWISPPVKVKHLGVITNIITNMYESSITTPNSGELNIFGTDVVESYSSLVDILSQVRTTITEYKIQVHNNKVELLGSSENSIAGTKFEIPVRQGTALNWDDALDVYPGKYIAGVSKLFLLQSNGSEIVGTVALDPANHAILAVNWDPDTLVKDTLIDSTGLFQSDHGFDQSSARGKVDAIIDPLTYNPKRPLKERDDQPIPIGIRYLLIEDIGDVENIDGADAWKSVTGEDLVATANDIIEWDGIHWNVIFDSSQEYDTMVWQTNIYTGVQYLWNGVSWVKSFEGIYEEGFWRLEL